MLREQPLVRARLLDRVQVGADHVLGHGERQRVAVPVPYLRWYLLQLRLLRRPVAPLARDDHEAVTVWGERERRDDPVLFH